MKKKMMIGKEGRVYRSIPITNQLSIGWIDDGSLCVQQCVCGYNKGFIINDEKKYAYKCPNCKRMFFFKQEITIYELKEENF